MTTRIYLVRHGATVLSAEDRFAGRTDVPLSEEGRNQVRRLAARLAKEPIAAFYAMETARILAEPHHKPVIPKDGLREIDHGRWEEKTRAEVEKLYPEEYTRWETDPFSFAPQGGESGLSVTARALPALLEIVSAHPAEHAAIASHKATIRLLICSILGFDARTYRDRLDQSPASLNILDFKDPTRGRLTLYNDTSHYAVSDSAVPGEPQARLSKWWDRKP